MLGLDAVVTIDAGAYSVWPNTSTVEGAMAGGILPGPYNLGCYRMRTFTVATNKPPICPYRSVARTGVTFAMDILIDALAREVERASRLPAASPVAFLQGQELIPDFRVSLARAQHQHRRIYEAVRDREGARAEALAREHARLARANLEYVMHEQPGLADRVPGLALVAE